MAVPANNAAYRGMVSARSRRLRVGGTVLLVAIAVMAIYGGASLMPNLRANIARYNELKASPAAGQAALRRQEAALKVHLLTSYAFWAGCGTLALALLTVGWLDWREVQRAYMDQRRAIWSEVGNRHRGETGIPDDVR